ncbi:MAG: hypothetical protein R2875_13385 [Desulfobacterales bacterium]
MVAQVAAEYIVGADFFFWRVRFATHGAAAKMIEVFGTENKKSCIWVKCIPASGGTMVLTEPEAGS